jgi:manganese transport protein
MTRVYGPDTADRETEADERYLAEVVQGLEAQGYETRSIILYGPDRAARLISQLKAEPVDLLVVGSHGHGMVRDLLFGQTVDKVRHGLTIPMLIARPVDEP